MLSNLKLQRRLDAIFQLYSVFIPLPFARCKTKPTPDSPDFLELSSPRIVCKHKVRLKQSALYGLFLGVQLLVLAHQDKHSKSSLFGAMFLSGIHTVLLLVAVGLLTKRHILVSLYNRLYKFELAHRGKIT